MQMEKIIQELHKEVGGEFDPFILTKYMGAEITYSNLGNVLGVYQAMQDKHFFINSAVSHEKQEDVCLTLITHYSNNKEVDLWITEETYGETMRDERIYAIIKRVIMKNNQFSVLFGKKIKAIVEKKAAY